MNIDEMKDRIARAEEIQRYTENRCEALEKENAELKEINSKTLAQLNLDNGELITELTKAKELLKKFMKFYERTARECYSKDFQKTLAEAEQFLNSEVEK